MYIFRTIPTVQAKKLKSVGIEKKRNEKKGGMRKKRKHVARATEGTAKEQQEKKNKDAGDLLFQYIKHK